MIRRLLMAVSMPVDDNRAPMQLTPAKTALAQDNTAAATSQEITLNTSTQLLEVNAVDDHIYMKWGTDNATSSNFDGFIQAGGVRHYPVPTDTTAVNFIDNGNTGTVVTVEY